MYIVFMDGVLWWLCLYFWQQCVGGYYNCDCGCDSEYVYLYFDIDWCGVEYYIYCGQICDCELCDGLCIDVEDDLVVGEYVELLG